MDPNNVPQANLDLPRPVAHEGQEGVDPNAYPEKYPSQQEAYQPASPGPAASVNPFAANPSAQSRGGSQPSTTSSPLPSTTQATSDDMAAEDLDLIEKAWVLKAKAIVENTRNDPHEQNIELNKIKAEYIKKRYNKDVKVSEG